MGAHLVPAFGLEVTEEALVTPSIVQLPGVLGHVQLRVGLMLANPANIGDRFALGAFDYQSPLNLVRFIRPASIERRLFFKFPLSFFFVFVLQE